jgi:hypothetical protein
VPKEIDEVKTDRDPKYSSNGITVQFLAEECKQNHREAEDDVKAHRPDYEGEHRTFKPTPFDGPVPILYRETAWGFVGAIRVMPQAFSNGVRAFVRK